MADGSSERFVLLNHLADEFAARYRRGERPSLQEYIDRHPELADDIRAFFPTLVEMEQVKDDREAPVEQAASHTLPTLKQLGDFRIIREIGHGGMGVVYEAEQVSLGRRVALKVLPNQLLADARTKRRFEREARSAAKLHHTNIVPVFGVGEHDGLPYYVMQFIQGLGLDEVLGELRKLQSDSARSGPSAEGELRVSRKELSAAAVARSLLTGEYQPAKDDAEASAVNPRAADEIPHSQALSDSLTLSSSSVLLGQSRDGSKSRKQTYWQSVARIGVQVADALEYAHKQGVTHRDIKPSNLLLDTQGTVWVTDFGLAKADDQQNLTHTGDILGTLRYMPPEAFEGRTDARSDVYSLGLTLYELLAMRAAFEETDRRKLIKRVTTEEPERLVKLKRSIPRDLATIVHKAIDRDPARRYQSAAELAEDLQRFVDDRPIKARRVGEWERLWRWGRRNPSIASLMIAVVLLLALGTVASTIAALYLNKAKQDADEAARVADSERQRAVDAGKQESAARERAEGSLYAARLSLIENSLRAEDSVVAGQILDKCLPQPGQRDRRGWEWHYLYQWAHAEQASWQVHPSDTGFAVAFNPDGRSFASAGGGYLYYLNPGNVVEPGEAVVCEFPSGEVRFRLRGHGHLVLALAYSPDGKRLATASTDRTVKLWSAETGQLQATLNGHAKGVNAVSWNRDGRRLASGGSDGTIKLWDVTSLKEIASFKGHEDVHKDHADSGFTIEWWRGVSGLSWDPTGRRLASASNDGTVKLWEQDPAVGPLIIPSGRFNMSQGRPAAWSPDGARVAYGDDDNQVHIHDATTGKRLHVLDSLCHVRAVVFSPDGRRLATGGESGVLRLWDTHTGKRVLDLLGHVSSVTGLSFAPDGRHLLSCGMDGTVKLWDTERDPRGRAIPDGDAQIAALSFTPDGTRFRAANAHFNTPAGGPFHFRTWDSASGKLLDRFEVGVTSRPAWPRGDFAFSPDARLLLAPTRKDDKIAAIWDAQSGKQLVAFRGHSNPVTAAAFSPKGDLVATAAQKGKEPACEIKLWDVRSGAEIHTFASVPYTIEALAFSLDGRKLASGGLGVFAGAATVWETTSGRLLRHMGGKLGYVKHLAFHLDGVRLAAADYKLGSVHVWNADTGEERIELPGAGATSCVSYSPDGRRLAAMGYDANVRLWDADSEQDLFVLRTFAPPPGTLGFTPRFAFSPDGSRIVANSAHGILSLWDARTDAQNKRLQADRAANQHALGLIHLAKSELEKARRHLEQAVALREALARDEPNNAHYQADLAASRLALESVPLRMRVIQLFVRFDGYCQAGKTAEATKLLPELLADVRKLYPKDSPQLAGMFALFGMSLLQAHAFPDAEALLRECLAIREKTQPDAWTTFNTMSLLGGALSGQKKHADAEPLLVKGYEGMKQREKTIPQQGGAELRIPEALDRLIAYYTATNKPEEAKKWRAERAKYPETKEPEAKR